MAISMRIAADQASCRRLVAPARPARRVLSVRAVAAPEQQAAAGKPAVPAGASARQPLWPTHKMHASPPSQPRTMLRTRAN